MGLGHVFIMDKTRVAKKCLKVNQNVLEKWKDIDRDG
jgi:hypothetical protein